MNLAELASALSSKRFDEVEAAFREALADPAGSRDLLLAACRGLSRAGQKSRLQSLGGVADEALKEDGSPEAARLRWDILKESVRAGVTPSTTDGFHRLFEDAISGAYPGAPALEALLGRFQFRDARAPADGMARMEKVEKWLPFELGRVFFMPGRGAGKVVETNYQLEAVRVDFEKAKGVSVPIGVAARQMEPLPETHFLRDKLADPARLASEVEADPADGVRRLLLSFGKMLTLSEVKEAFSGLVPEERWNSFWSAARRHPQVVVHGTGRNAQVEWTASAGEADEKLVARFEKMPLREQLDFFRRHGKRSADLASRLAATLAEEARSLAQTDPALTFEISFAIERTTGAGGVVDLDALVADAPLAFLARLEDRLARERALEAFGRRDPAGLPRVLADWFFKEEDGRTLDVLDRRLAEIDPALRDQTIDRLLKNPRQGPRAFLWFALRAESDESLRLRLSPSVVGRMLDAISWEELGAGRAKLRDLFDRTGLVAAWLVKQATADEAASFLEVLQRHHELEPHRVRALQAAAEMRFPEFRRKREEDIFFVTPESIEERRRELEHITEVEIPENTKGIAAAAAEGDLSENFEYKARRDRQQLLSARAGKLQEDLARARALDPATVDASEIRPGTRVLFETLKGPRTITLLGPWDSRPEDGVYSYLADFGLSLLGRKLGDEVNLLGQQAVVMSIEVWR